MTYDEAIAFWYGRINYEVRAAQPGDLKLERMRAVLKLLGDPHDRVRLVHVTGTKGKGSTCAMVASVLRCAGYRVGLFTSPHLEHVEERIQVDGVPITHAELAARMAEVATAVRQLEVSGPPITFFEIGTALGFLHFCRRRCDVAVIEVGLGGRFDSTNVCNPLVSVITNVGFDHTAQLGNTLEAIAFQKAGIIKRRVPAISGVTQPEARDVVRAIAVELDAPLWEINDPASTNPPTRRAATLASTSPTGGEVSSLTSPPVGEVDARRSRAAGGGTSSSTGIELALLGKHQAQNAAVAVAAIDVLRRARMPISEAAIERGLATVHWPARIELVSRSPAIILDTAHNVPSAEALVATLRENFSVPGTKSVVFAVSSDKQYVEMLSALAGYFDHFHFTKYGNPRGVPPEKLAAVLAEVSPGKPFTLHATSREAWLAARTAASADDLVCITGSVFLAGELQPLVRAEL